MCHALERRRGRARRAMRPIELNTFVRRRRILKAAGTASSMAALLALSGQPVARARSELIAAAQGTPGSDLLTLDPSSPQFRGLTQGFNRRWTAPNAAVIYVPLTEDGAEEALSNVLANGYG